MDWRERWEQDADAELNALSDLPLVELVRRIEAGKFGAHYVIWDAVATKKDLPAVGWLLYDFVKSTATYLHRYHCARALLSLLSCSKYQAADLTVEHLKPAKALADLEVILEGAIGPRPVAV